MQAIFKVYRRAIENRLYEIMLKVKENR